MVSSACVLWLVSRFGIRATDRVRQLGSLLQQSREIIRCVEHHVVAAFELLAPPAMAFRDGIELLERAIKAAR
jgi:hypothetical protein